MVRVAFVSLLIVVLGLASGAPAHAATKRATDREAGVRFTLVDRVLIVRILESAPRRIRRAIQASRVRVACQRYTPARSVSDTRRWPRARLRLRFRFERNISRAAAWCLLEHRRGGDIAFASFQR
jgi:hypothetical protein